MIAAALSISAFVLASPSPVPIQTRLDSAGVAVPLYAKGGNIADTAGRRVTLTGVNWFGYETS